MGLAEWIASFRTLHEAHKKGTLSREEEATYLGGREELARAVLAAQRLAQQRVAAQVDLGDRQVIRGAPVGVHSQQQAVVGGAECIRRSGDRRVSQSDQSL